MSARKQGATNPGATNPGAASAGNPASAGNKGAAPGATGAGQADGHAGAHARESVAHLIKMANDIGHFFQAEDRREDAVLGVANHIRKYWTPRMRDKLLEYVARPADPELPALEALPREAIEQVLAAPSAKHALAPGGDPGGDAG
ncbi:MAG TPA: formate dehydrogenase subunit delta [Steroidobacteraceae bacterium]|nr:formate dehydrogenase subunit delta [Steroidobacteraceae bacterium]